MPVEISYRPRPSIFSDPLICVSFVSLWTLADLINILDHLNRTLQPEQVHQLCAARAMARGNADERHISSFRAAGVIHRVADVEQLLSGMHRGDLQQTVRRGLFTLHIVGGNQQEPVADALALERDFGLL